jgi:hypothetical protein
VTIERIGRYARGYAQVARIQATFSKILSEHGIDPDQETFEADILLDAEVNRLASKRAESDGVDYAAVARALLFAAAAKSRPDPQYDPARRPPFRARTNRARLRFIVPRAPYDDAKAAILASRRSVSHALEDELRNYAEKGFE